MMKLKSLFKTAFVLGVAAASLARATDHEVWVIDQSNTRSDGGGGLYIYSGDDLAGADAAAAVPEYIDLGDDARTLALAQTGTAPVRPHMFFFNAAQTHAIIAYVATGHVLFMDAATRMPLGAIDVGLQAHAAVPTANERFVLVANQNGKLLQRIRTDYLNNSFTLDSDATVDLAAGLTPSGAPRQDPLLRPDNAPICIGIDNSSRFGFVTLRGGGLFVVDLNATPMRIVAEYDRSVIAPNGCGTTEAAGKMYINAGGGGAARPYAAELYAFPLSGFSEIVSPPNLPAPLHIFSYSGVADSHGAVVTRHQNYLWVADRAANLVVVVDTRSDAVINEIDLLSELSSDPAPDLLAAAPSGNRVYATLRGSLPLTGNNPAVNNAKGATPGLAILRVIQNGRNGVLQAIVPISNIVDGVERADPHGIGVRLK
jgi:hypothetical protein